MKRRYLDKQFYWNVFEQLGMFLVFIILFASCKVFIPNFTSEINMRGLALAVSTTGIVACTMLFCLASGNFDLSVGSMVAATGVITAFVMRRADSMALGLLAGLGTGALVGFINGFLIAVLRINALIATLATMQIVRGLGYIVASGRSVPVSQPDFLLIGAGLNPVWITIACFCAYGFLLRKTVFGRNTLAIGGNEEAARLAGIPVARTKILIFLLQGVMAALAGIVLASRMEIGQPQANLGFELQVISACVLGGVSMSGGVGSMLFVVSGVLIMGTVENAMNLLNVETFWQYVVRGAILLAAVLIDKVKQLR